METGIDIKNIKKGLVRTEKIISAKSLERSMQNINSEISPSYTKKDIYKDLMMVAPFAVGRVKEIILNSIKTNDLEAIQTILENINYLLEEVFNELLDEKEFFDLLLNNFDRVLDYLCDKFKYIFIVKIFETEEGEKCIFENLKNNNFFQRAGFLGNRAILSVLLQDDNNNRLIEENFDKFFINGIDDLIVKVLIKKGIAEDKIIKHKKEVLDNAFGKDIISFIRWFKKRKTGKSKIKGILTCSFFSLFYFVSILCSM